MPGRRLCRPREETEQLAGRGAGEQARRPGSGGFSTTHELAFLFGATELDMVVQGREMAGRGRTAAGLHWPRHGASGAGQEGSSSCLGYCRRLHR